MSTIYSVYSERNLFDQSTNWVVTYHTFTYSGPWQEVGWLVSFCLSFPGNSSNDPILKRLAQPLSHTENQESCHFHGLNPGYCLGKQSTQPTCHLGFYPICTLQLYSIPAMSSWTPLFDASPCSPSNACRLICHLLHPPIIQFIW